MNRNGQRAFDDAPVYADAMEELHALLESSRLGRGDVRWLSGRLVDVLISPLRTENGGMAVVITVAATQGGPEDIAGVVIELVDAGGGTVTSTLDEGGHATLPLTTEHYRLCVRRPAPVPLGNDPAELAPARARRPAALLPMVAAVVLGALMVGSTLLVVGNNPAEAVEVRALTEDCGPPPGPAGRPHVEVAAAWAGEEKQRFREVLAGFVARTGINVTLSNAEPTKEEKASQPNRDLARSLTSRLEAGCQPDVALLPQTGLLRDLQSRGHLVAIEEIAGPQVDRNYNPAWRELGSVDEVLYGVWFKASDKSLIWYNTAAFERAGIEPPASWAGLKQAAATLQASGVTPFAVAGKDGWTLTDWFENVYLRTAGPGRYKDLAEGRIPWTDASVRTALVTLAEVLGRHDWIAGGTEGGLSTTYEESVRKVFDDPHDPEAAMVFEGDFVANEVAQTPSKVGVHARSFPFPSIGASAPGPVVGPSSATNPGEATGGDVAVLLRSHHAADELLRYLAMPEAPEPWIRAGGFLSPNKSAVNAYPDVTSEAAAARLVEAQSLSFDLSDQMPAGFGSTVGKGMWLILQDFLRDPSDPETTVRRLQEGYEQALRDAQPK